MNPGQPLTSTPPTSGATTMKAFVRPGYGPPDVLELVDVELPSPEPRQVLVRVRATCVNPVDWHEVTGTPYFMRAQAGLRRPKEVRIGSDFAGVVEAVGADVAEWRPGDEVFGMRHGAFAEYVCVHADRVVRKPAGLTFEQAASIPVAALTALQALRDRGGIQAGQAVLVNGASGGVGTFAVQLAKAFGAEVTAVCSTRNVEAVRALGADHVIDYTRADIARAGRRYDLVVDVAGDRSIAERRRLLAPGATLVVVGGPKKNRVFGPLLRVARLAVAGRFGDRKMVFMIAKNNRDDLALLAELAAAGKVTPVVERTYPLVELPEALRYLGEGHARAKLAVTV